MNPTPNRLRAARPPAAAWWLGALLLVALPGCSSPRYKAAPKKTPPPVMLNLPATEPPIEALLHAVIVYRSAGSWKLDAFWDEYVMTVANRGHGSVVIESAAVTDFRDELVAAGTDPWKLEEASKVFAARDIARAGAIQIGANLGVVAIGSGVGAAMFAGGTIANTGAAVGGWLTLPVVVAGSIYVNLSNRGLIEREFQRRRITLPATLQPGEFVEGSFFFRIAPGPKRLTLQCRVDGEPREVAIPLAPLAGIHLQRIPTETTPAAK